jgi:16S rRNA (guanine966-N2)-methyltransferase
LLRIVSGKYRGRKLSSPKGKETRPTLEKTREIIFNTISSRYSLDHFVAVDLFAGSGAMGFEALSRGAKSVIFVDISKSNCRLIQRNIDKLGVGNDCRIFNADAIKWLEVNKWGEDPKMFFLDPPYQTKLGQQVFDLLGNTKYQINDSLLVLETDKDHALSFTDIFKIFRQKTVGKTRLDFFNITN